MRSLPLFLFLFVSVACGTEGPPPAELQDRLAGRWELAQATRSGRLTESLDGTFFEFDGAQLTTNVSGAASTAPYSLDGMVIESTDPRMEEEYTIHTLSADTLILHMEMRSYPFEFILLKATGTE